jgi:hypothetical protein
MTPSTSAPRLSIEFFSRSFEEAPDFLLLALRQTLSLNRMNSEGEDV